MILGESTFSVTPTHAAVRPQDLFVAFHKNEILLTEQQGMLKLPTFEQALPLLPHGQSPFELAHTDSCTLWSLPPAADETLAESGDVRYHPLGVFRTLPRESAALIVSCRHLWMWYQTNRFCGCCGQALVPHECERALRCPTCGHVQYPVIAPAVIVAVTHGDSILLAKNVRSGSAHFALLSGYVEVGETLEHTARREVKEEVGLELKTLRYLGDQPWGISGAHMLAFQAEAASRGPIVLQKSEISEARWFARDELTPQPHTVSVAFELIERFRTGTL